MLTIDVAHRHFSWVGPLAASLLLKLAWCLLIPWNLVFTERHSGQFCLWTLFLKYMVSLANKETKHTSFPSTFQDNQRKQQQTVCLDSPCQRLMSGIGKFRWSLVIGKSNLRTNEKSLLKLYMYIYTWNCVYYTSFFRQIVNSKIPYGFFSHPYGYFAHLPFSSVSSLSLSCLPKEPLPHFPYQLTCVLPFLLTLLSHSSVFTFLSLLKSPFFPISLIRWLNPCYASLHSSPVPLSWQWSCFICLVSVVSTNYELTSEDLEFLTPMRENVWCLHFWIWVSGLSHSVWSFLISFIYLQSSWFHFLDSWNSIQ